MADWVVGQVSAPAEREAAARPRHAAVVRVTHWLTALSFLALLISGLEIVISHPRFYWGETGTVETQPLFRLPIPSSRATIPNGYALTLPDQNGWSRYLHFESAWVAVFTGLVYLVFGFWSGHFRKDLIPARPDLSLKALAAAGMRHLRRGGSSDDAASYNAVQRIAYLAVIFVLFPVMIWTGLAMSPAFGSVAPMAVTVWGGQQSARTIHFLVTLLLVLFLIVHIAMVLLAGFRRRVRAMITGGE